MPTPTDRRLRWSTFIGVALILIGVAVITVITVGVQSGQHVQLDNEVISGCRAKFNTGKENAKTALDDARAAHELAGSDLELVQNEELDAIVDRDSTKVDALRTLAVAARATVRERQLDVNKARDLAMAATTDYSDAVALSVSDRDRFLAGCRP